MSLAKDLNPSAWDPSDWADIVLPPSAPESEEPPMESDLHLRQMLLLIECLDAWWQDRQDAYWAGNMSVYYSPRQIKNREFKGPDFFVVLGTDRRPRKSWTVWEEEGKYPNLIVELLSQSTANIDRELKKQLYQDTFRTPEYFWFDPESLEFAGFTLVGGHYQPIEVNAQGWLWSQQLELFLGVHERKLRFFTPDGRLILTGLEQSAQLRQENDRLTAKLRELGIDPQTLQ
jgi:Uma2 family endonuclease